ncbi:MAG TPA: universal stress protein [Ktedonobacteraceae bacterium]|nr:universal stress protein [Ktedonobacteraceae bacterium]
MTMLHQKNQGHLRFLVPLDGSRLAESVLPVVQQMASRFHAQVTLLHIVEKHPPTVIHGEPHLTSVAQAQAYLEEITTRLRSSALPVEIHVHRDKEDDVARSIVQHAQEVNADLVIMCTHGHGGLRELLFGSNAQQALQQGTQSILLLFPREDGSVYPFNLQRILVPLDGTVAHEPALPVAITIARTFGAELHLVLVIPTLATLSGEQAVSGLLLPTTMRAVLDLAQQGAADYLEQAVARCRAEGVVAQAEVLRGDIVPVVLGLAERLNVDLIVLASHGRTGLDALLTGSVASRIAGRRIRPLLLVRAEKPVGGSS